MAAVTIHTDFGAQENNLPLFPFPPHLFAIVFYIYFNLISSSQGPCEEEATIISPILQMRILSLRLNCMPSISPVVTSVTRM